MKHYAPTTPSRRHMTTVDYGTLTKERPVKRLLRNLKQHAGRNNQGRITVRHQGGGNKKLYRLVDFRQQRMDVPATIEAIEYDPYRTCFIARLRYRDGQVAYALAANGVKTGEEIVTSDSAPQKTGNRMRLKNIPVGTLVHNVELRPGQGGVLARSAGSSSQVLAHEDGYAHLKMASGEVRKVLWDGFATLGQVSNPDHSLTTIGKAGRSRWLGIRPTVRGSAMNAVDHPYGGGEGRALRGTKRPKTAWGKVTGGRKTRNKKKWSNPLIVSRRPK
ncbi:MAG: 50S ribosomal protein L2 [Candidatus Liptonbacteria bacterium GWC1_60_9]|uniref:Large ribosomal subunit protein uL2 n=3 Tax=Candidatus Liptoniibacteriota TaxID=1817909 RepID=A0A1G2CLK4_9BACT|nr:MAG: LSU ribosomal protein L2 [Parcubacteria group bacterium GW2011_GWA1_60_11]OGY97276.1 MAG: 50S ribosomal protein L2 [Candidatus Liptonbacteria bacterium GWC1_60_9]OGY98735.1 MAG: 50S ribosomal protein L2 [Candidatus Liptonbacteria bacterium RIFCSPHIGHO2_12_FULL_60_13]OGZ02275.1 MAG: 50S ribosomal protein L2 [Candidatus Liptonbacteria bacterium RIFCSPLOWO2_12_FULL_60_15]